MMAVGEAARDAGLPLVAHATELRQATVAVQAGASVLIRGVGDQPLTDAFVAPLVERNTVSVPTLTVFDGYRRLWAGALGLEPVQIDDPHRCVDEMTRGLVESTAQYADKAKAQGWSAERLAALDGVFETQGEVAQANVRRLREVWHLGQLVDRRWARRP